jgi:hypothetical protein
MQARDHHGISGGSHLQYVGVAPFRDRGPSKTSCAILHAAFGKAGSPQGHLLGCRILHDIFGFMPV